MAKIDSLFNLMQKKGGSDLHLSPGQPLMLREAGDLHTNSAAKTVDRIINVFPTNQQEQIRAMLGESLKGVLAQQLLKTTDGKRCAALEILSVNPAVSNLIRAGKTFQIPSVIQTGKNEEMQLMDQAIQNLYKEKRISAEEACRYASNKNLFPKNAEVRAP